MIEKSSLSLLNATLNYYYEILENLFTVSHQEAEERRERDARILYYTYTRRCIRKSAVCNYNFM